MPCALDAPCAPWNDGHRTFSTTRFGFMRRYVCWWLGIVGRTMRESQPLDHYGLWWQRPWSHASKAKP